MDTSVVTITVKCRAGHVGSFLVLLDVASMAYVASVATWVRAEIHRLQPYCVYCHTRHWTLFIEARPDFTEQDALQALDLERSYHGLLRERMNFYDRN